MISSDLLSVLMCGIGAKSHGWGDGLDPVPAPAADFGAILEGEADAAGAGSSRGSAWPMPEPESVAADVEPVAPEAAQAEGPRAAAAEADLIPAPLGDARVQRDAAASIGGRDAGAADGADPAARLLSDAASAPEPEAARDAASTLRSAWAERAPAGDIGRAPAGDIGREPAGNLGREPAARQAATVAPAPSPNEAGDGPPVSRRGSSTPVEAGDASPDRPAPPAPRLVTDHVRTSLEARVARAEAGADLPGADTRVDASEAELEEAFALGRREPRATTPERAPEPASAASLAQALSYGDRAVQGTRDAEDWRLLSALDAETRLSPVRAGGGLGALAAGAPPAAPQAVAGQVVAAILSGSDERIEIRLDPPELGRVRIEMRVVEGTLHALLLSERPETADILRRHAEALQRELEEAGYASVSLDFASHDEGAAAEQRERIEIETGPGGSEAAAASGSAALARAAIGTGGLDIRL